MGTINCLLVLMVMSTTILMNNAQKRDKTGILSGDPTPWNENTYLVNVLNSYDELVCGGGIIRKNLIVSAANCFINEDYTINPGPYRVTLYLPILNDPYNVNYTQSKVINIYIPSSYNTTTGRDNIAVLKLEKNIHLKKSGLTRLKIPKKGTFDNSYAVIAGQGWDEVVVQTNQNDATVVDGSTLGFRRRAMTQVMNNTVCEDITGKHIEDTMLCAKVVKEDWERHYGTCRHDEGSPLVYGLSTIIGVLIKPTDTCDETVDPAVYTRITSQLGFLTNAMQNNLVDMTIVNV